MLINEVMKSCFFPLYVCANCALKTPYASKVKVCGFSFRFKMPRGSAEWYGVNTNKWFLA